MGARKLILVAALLLGACDTGDGDLAVAETQEIPRITEDASEQAEAPAVAITLQNPVGTVSVDDAQEKPQELVAEVDLNGDGVNEIIAYKNGPTRCGSGGCNVKIAQRTEDGELRVVGQLTVSRLPVGIFETTTNGWRDLAVGVGGGGERYGMVRVPFDGQAYASNPTAFPAERTQAPFETLIEQVMLNPARLG